MSHTIHRISLPIFAVVILKPPFLSFRQVIACAQKSAQQKPAILTGQILFKMHFSRKYVNISLFFPGVDILVPCLEIEIPGLPIGARKRPGIVLLFRACQDTTVLRWYLKTALPFIPAGYSLCPKTSPTEARYFDRSNTV
jgi:hypothetical protein